MTSYNKTFYQLDEEEEDQFIFHFSLSDDGDISISFQINLRHNRVPFVTGKMFPESKWIPYRLEHLDLSHNNMPVITKEMLVGTKYLKYLNISYNILTDIREGQLKTKEGPFLHTRGL